MKNSLGHCQNSRFAYTFDSFEGSFWSSYHTKDKDVNLSCLIACTDSFFGQDNYGYYLNLCLITDGRTRRISSN